LTCGCFFVKIKSIFEKGEPIVSKTVEAIFENGVLKPVSPLNIPEHKKVTIFIKDEIMESFDVLSLASMVYDGLSHEDIEEIEKLALDRSHFTRH
jgi:predicted DNA-binding antitoxin AbrB/MazE fold protein